MISFVVNSIMSLNVMGKNKDIHIQIIVIKDQKLPKHQFFSVGGFQANFT